MEISKITSPLEWTYFAKGNANILFQYKGQNDYLTHKLLRVRLLKEDDQYILTCELYDFIELKCKHLFPQQIIDIQLTVLTADFVTRLDNRGNPIKLTERYGLLIPNILDGNYQKQFLLKNCHLYVGAESTENRRSRRGSRSAPESQLAPVSLVILEMKPKWLYDNTLCNYCRTCLLNQLREHPRHFCPLDLLYDGTLDRGIDDIFLCVPPELMHSIEASRIPLKTLFRIFLANPNNVFQKLKEYQKINNKNDLIENLTSPADVLLNLSLVMTLRDVGLFIKFEKYDRRNNVHNSQNNINNLVSVEGYGRFLLTCNIYDLDLKSRMKYRHWLELENKLKSIYNSSNPEWRHCVRHEHSNSWEM